MGNMSYCRFENTDLDMRDCLEHMDDILPEDEHRARIKLFKKCQKVVDCFDLEDLKELQEDR